MKRTQGIHHITSIVGHPQENVDFYAGVLGLRLVKKTVNFDDPQTYHLYFGNKEAQPGTIITFFPWASGKKGTIGSGQVGVTTYAIPPESLSFWENRLNDQSVTFEKTIRFGEEVLQFEDVHGLKLELVERESGPLNTWSNTIPSDVAIKGFGGAVLYSNNPKATIETLTDTMGLTYLKEEQNVVRLQADGELGNLIDIPLNVTEPGHMGVGTVHHIAWRALDEEDHADWQSHVRTDGYHVTEIKDRQYFKALYFREYGQILFEIASDTPGFTVDETADEMGTALKLPEQYEQHREKLEGLLPPIEVTN
ncbi:MAG: ring-cleaving dioxygenase [Alkalibacterium sp.]|nr:ring-cleaving dioxygenase [Alkalibacterium sp.]